MPVQGCALRAGWSGDRIPVEGEIFRTYPDQPWGPPNPTEVVGKNFMLEVMLFIELKFWNYVEMNMMEV